MTGPCKVWNGESVPPFAQPLGRRRYSRRLPHFAPLRRRGYVCNYSNTLEAQADTVTALNLPLRWLLRLFVLRGLLALGGFLLLDRWSRGVDG